LKVNPQSVIITHNFKQRRTAMLYYSCIFLIAAFFGLLIASRYIINELRGELFKSKQLFKITYDLLWMQVRDKNDLTYDNMASHIISMQKAELGNVRETLAKRICGEKTKHMGF